MSRRQPFRPDEKDDCRALACQEVAIETDPLGVVIGSASKGGEKALVRG
jgi:hypothetical protein